MTPDDAASAIRMMEIRAWIRSEGEVESKLLNAASAGDVETFQAITRAPSGMFTVNPKTLRLAETALADKVDPEGAQTLRDLTEAVDAYESVMRAARQHISEVSGARGPHERLAEGQRTGVIPPAP